MKIEVSFMKIEIILTCVLHIMTILRKTIVFYILIILITITFVHINNYHHTTVFINNFHYI